MIQFVSSKIAKILRSSNERSDKIIKNVLLSFGTKGGSILIGLMLVPLTINYINSTKYGIWLTISSIAGWMSFFDFGMGNGLKNKLAQALALNEIRTAQIYVSTTYFILAGLATLLFLSYFLISSFLNWNDLLNIPTSVSENIQLVILITVGCFCVQFIVQTINVVLAAIQEPAKASLISFFGQFALLITVFTLKYTVEGNLIVLVLALTVVPVIVMLLASFILYNSKLKSISPSISMVDLSHVKSIFGVGSVFFVLQLGSLVLFQTDNIVITRVLGPEAVTEFNVTHKLFSIVTMVFTIIVTPYWSAFTDAYTKGDYAWIEANLKLVRKLWLIVTFLVVPVIWLLSPWIFEIWIGGTVPVSSLLSISMACYVIGITGMMVNCYFLNGVGKVRIQLILYLIVCIVNIPLSVLLCRLIGVSGVVLSNVLMFALMCIVLWIQSNKIVYKKASGIWNK